MSRSQFFRINGYGRHPRRGEPAWATIEHIGAEVARLPGATRHLSAPRPPVLLHGVSAEDAARSAVAVAEQARDSAGRKLRSDGNVLFAAVASYPIPCTALESEPALSEYLKWRARVIRYLLEWLGPRGVSIVEHKDESHPHLHALIVPAIGADGQLDLAWHPGHLARKHAKLAGMGHVEQEKAYRQGLRDCLDRYHAAVSAPCGHSRAGARRTRLRRREALARKAAEDALLRARDLARSTVAVASTHAKEAGLWGLEPELLLQTLESGFSEALAIVHGAGKGTQSRPVGIADPSLSKNMAPADNDRQSPGSEPREPAGGWSALLTDPYEGPGAHFDEMADDGDRDDDPDPEAEPTDFDYDDDPDFASDFEYDADLEADSDLD